MKRLCIFALALGIACWLYPAHAEEKRRPIKMPIDVFTGKPADYKPPGEPAPQAPPKPDKNAKSPAFLRAQQQCNPSLARAYNRMYVDLKGVTLFVYISPGQYVIADKCRGHEEECTDRVKHYSEQERIDYLNHLIENNKRYREPLHRENLIRVFSDMLRQKVMPLVLPDDGCKVPDLVLVEGGSDDLRAAENTPDMLTVAVELAIIDTTKPPIAVIVTDFHRPNIAQAKPWPRTLTGDFTAIPLDLPDDQILSILKRFTDRFEVMTDKMGEP